MGLSRLSTRCWRISLLAVGLVSAVVMTTGSTEAWASFTKSTTAASATYSTGTLAAPTSLRCTSVVSASVDLAWTAPTGVTTPSLLRYDVKRKPSGGSFTTISTSQTATTLHDVPGLLGTFVYVVNASYRNWTSPDSATETVTFAAITSLCSP